MYNPRHFAESNRARLVADVRALAIGELITYGSSGIEASIVPLLIDDDATLLTGHLARANPQWRTADLNVPVLVTWRGPDAYVSPSYYPSKAEHGKVVPTWNYTTVQARGHLTVHDDPAWVERLVRALTDHHEANRTVPWSVDDAPREYIDSMVRAVVGISVDVVSIEGKNKLSQNRPSEDVAGVVAALEASSGHEQLVATMRERNRD
jgi:transcriptional regulator